MHAYFEVMMRKKHSPSLSVGFVALMCFSLVSVVVEMLLMAVSVESVCLDIVQISTTFENH